MRLESLVADAVSTDSESRRRARLAMVVSRCSGVSYGGVEGARELRTLSKISGSWRSRSVSSGEAVSGGFEVNPEYRWKRLSV